MRHIDSSYDRAAISAAQAAQQAREALAGGATLDYDDPLITALDDMAWDDLRDEIIEVPGEGYRLA